ncbi:MAG: AAA family ATPase [Sulfitobacter sp.]
MPFVSDFAPRQFSDLILPDQDVAAKLRLYSTFGCNDHLLLFGPAGTAKTTVVQLLQELRDLHSGVAHQEMVIEGTDWKASSIDAIENLWSFQRTNGVEVPIFVINEVDELTMSQQNKLRAYLSKRLGQLCVMMTTNNIGKLREPIRDRCVRMHMPKIHFPDWLPRVQQYLRQNGVSLPDPAILKVLNTSNGSIRDLGRVVDDLVHAHQAKAQKSAMPRNANSTISTKGRGLNTIAGNSV